MPSTTPGHTLPLVPAPQGSHTANSSMATGEAEECGKPGQQDSQLVFPQELLPGWAKQGLGGALMRSCIAMLTAKRCSQQVLTHVCTRWVVVFLRLMGCAPEHACVCSCHAKHTDAARQPRDSAGHGGQHLGVCRGGAGGSQTRSGVGRMRTQNCGDACRCSKIVSQDQCPRCDGQRAAQAPTFKAIHLRRDAGSPAN
eukprot:1161702-Pelagomonas_calceolata.AAC.5